jgi:hypothetical protein
MAQTPIRLLAHPSRRTLLHVLRPRHDHRYQGGQRTGLPRQVVAALDGTAGAEVGWTDSKVLNH